MLGILTYTSRAWCEGCWEALYTSANLTNHLISAEPWPGDPNPPTSPVITTADVKLAVYDGYAEVIANPRLTNVFVNAIAAQRFMDTFPDGSPIELDVFRYGCWFRCLAVPTTDIAQTQNGQNAHMMIQMWDGANRVWQADKVALESTVMWSLSAWETNTYGKLLLYTTTTGPLELVDTGLTLPVDTNWHNVEFVADFVNRKFVSICADGVWADIGAVGIARLLRADWGSELLYHITQESSSLYPGPGYSNIFAWTMQYRDIAFSRLNLRLGFAENPLTNGSLLLKWDTAPYMEYRVAASPDLNTWSNLSGMMAGTGAALQYSAPITNDGKMFYRLQLVP